MCGANSQLYFSLHRLVNLHSRCENPLSPVVAWYPEKVTVSDFNTQPTDLTINHGIAMVQRDNLAALVLTELLSVSLIVTIGLPRLVSRKVALLQGNLSSIRGPARLGLVFIHKMGLLHKRIDRPGLSEARFRRLMTRRLRPYANAVYHLEKGRLLAGNLRQSLSQIPLSQDRWPDETFQLHRTFSRGFSCSHSRAYSDGASHQSEISTACGPRFQWTVGVQSRRSDGPLAGNAGSCTAVALPLTRRRTAESFQ
jgi:hypothetical protein